MKKIISLIAILFSTIAASQDVTHERIIESVAGLGMVISTRDTYQSGTYSTAIGCWVNTKCTIMLTAFTTTEADRIRIYTNGMYAASLATTIDSTVVNSTPLSATLHRIGKGNWFVLSMLFSGGNPCFLTMQVDTVTGAIGEEHWIYDRVKSYGVQMASAVVNDSIIAYMIDCHTQTPVRGAMYLTIDWNPTTGHKDAYIDSLTAGINANSHYKMGLLYTNGWLVSQNAAKVYSVAVDGAGLIAAALTDSATKSTSYASEESYAPILVRPNIIACGRSGTSDMNVIDTFSWNTSTGDIGTLIESGTDGYHVGTQDATYNGGASIGVRNSVLMLWAQNAVSDRATVHPIHYTVDGLNVDGVAVQGTGALEYTNMGGSMLKETNLVHNGYSPGNRVWVILAQNWNCFATPIRVSGVNPRSALNVSGKNLITACKSVNGVLLDAVTSVGGVCQ